MVSISMCYCVPSSTMVSQNQQSRSRQQSRHGCGHASGSMMWIQPPVAKSVDRWNVPPTGGSISVGIWRMSFRYNNSLSTYYIFVYPQQYVCMSVCRIWTELLDDMGLTWMVGWCRYHTLLRSGDCILINLSIARSSIVSGNIYLSTFFSCSPTPRIVLLYNLEWFIVFGARRNSMCWGDYLYMAKTGDVYVILVDRDTVKNNTGYDGE